MTTTQERDLKTESLVLYVAETGEKYHRKAACAARGYTSPSLDAGADLFDRLTVVRYGEASPSDSELCDNCAAPLVQEVDL